MKNRYVLLIILSFIFQFSGLVAQEKTVIRGRVIEKSTGVPLPGVNIIEFDNQNRIIKGVITDINGNFTLEVTNAEHEIQVSYIGYTRQNFNIDNRTIINIELEQETTQLEEVSVVARYEGDHLTGVSFRDQTGAAVRVDMDKLTGMAGASVETALQGRVSGLDIVSTGSPGGGSSIIIRGMGSIGNTNPLIVIDGIPQDVKTESFNFASADEHDLGQLLNIAPQDIKSVEVLKDAATTAVWGSKGANGVLIIETHKGSRGKITLNYQYKLGVNIQPPSIPMLNGDEYITLQREQWHNAYGIYNIPQEIAYDRNFIHYYNYTANTDWIKSITKNSSTHDHFFKISGGSEKTRYYTSINFQNEDGTTINTSFQRLSVRFNFDHDISKKLRIATSLNYNNTLREDNPQSELRYRGSKMNVRQLAYVRAPNMSIWEYDSNGKLTGEYFTPITSYQGSGDLYLNPVALSTLGINNVLGNRIENNFQINYFLTQWLTFRESISFAYINDKGKTFTPSSAIGADWLDWKNNRTDERNIIDIRLLSRTQLLLFPFRGLRNHSMTGVLMWEMEEKNSENLILINQKSPSLFIIDPARNSPNLPQGYTGSGSTQLRLFGGLASFNYKFKDRYLLSGNIRTDGSSSFGANNQWGMFPSVSLGWRFTDENFMKSLNFISESMIRLSWGQAGKAIENEAYPTFSYYVTSGEYLDLTAIEPAQMQLDNLKWQTVTTWNGGIDLNIFKERIYVTLDFYRKLTTNLLWRNYRIPESTSFSTLNWFNGGNLQNVGWEFFTRGTVIDRDKINFSLNFNISQKINSFEEFPENFNLIQGSDIGNGVYPRKAEVGKPIGSFYGFRYLGVYPSDEDAIAQDVNGNILMDSNGNPIPMSYDQVYNFKGGDAIYEDINKDGKIDIMDVVYLGDSSPVFIGGFGASFGYRNFSTSVNFHYRLNFDIVNQIAIETEGMLDRNNQSNAVLNRWRREGQDEKGILPRAYMNHPCNNLGSDRYVERGDFLRLNNFNLNYMVDKRIAEKLKLSNLEIRLVIRNLLTFTKYTGQDPEIGLGGTNPFFLGVDRAQTPPPKVYNLAVNMNF